MAYSIYSVVKWAIDRGANDSELNSIIESYIGNGDADSWRIDNYSFLRSAAYPPIEDFIDSMVKIAAGGSLALEGQSQLDTYNSSCISVKLRFPKI